MDQRARHSQCPAIRCARGTVFGATLIRHRYGLSGCWPPCTDLTGLPATGGFYFQASDGSVILAVAGYDYNSDWTPLLAGLSPAGMAASLAALVRPCFGLASKRSWQGAPKTRSTPSHQAQFWNRRDRYRYRQELVSRRGSRSAWHDRPAPEVVSWPSRNTVRQPPPCLIHGAASARMERDLEKIRCGTEFVLFAAVPPLSKKVCELDGVFTKSRWLPNRQRGIERIQVRCLDRAENRHPD